MFGKVKNWFKNIDLYLPGIAMISFGFIVLIMPYILVFLVSLMLVSFGLIFIASVKGAVKQESEIQHFNDFFRERARNWYNDGRFFYF